MTNSVKDGSYYATISYSSDTHERAIISKCFFFSYGMDSFETRAAADGRMIDDTG